MYRTKSILIRTKRSVTTLLVAVLTGNALLISAQTSSGVNRGSQGKTKMATVQTSNGSQGRGSGSGRVPVVTGGGACKAGWSGVINFSQTLDDEGKKDTSTDRSVSRQEWSHDVDFEGTMIVDGSDPKNTATSAEVDFTDVRMQHEIEDSMGQCGAWNPEHWFKWDHKQTDTETGNGKGPAENFLLSVDEAHGTYKLSFTFPRVPGKYVRDDRTTRSGHCQDKNNEPLDHGYKNATVIKGFGGTAEDQKINPNDPDVLEGSFKIDNNDYSRPGAPKSPITNFSWSFRRCPPPLMIADVKFYQLRYPSPSTWEEIEYHDHTIDGNEVKIAATIVNLSGAKRSATVNFKELKENVDLPQGKVPAQFEPYETKKVEYVWDTSGYAWKEASPRNEAEYFRKIEVKIPDDSKLKEVEVRPKPVVVIPGLWSKPDMLANFLAQFNRDKQAPWSASFAPVYVKQRAAESGQAIDKTVREVQERENAWHVDLVAHSTGGLISRVYVNGLMPTQYDGRPTATHLVMLGTPNMGTPCAGDGENIFTRFFGEKPESFAELSHTNMNVFNNTITRRNGTRFAAMVGNSFSPTCDLNESGDGLVPYISARWLVRDYVVTNERHEDLIGEVPFAQVRKWLAISPKGEHVPDRRQP